MITATGSRLVLATIGSRGDVQPMLALGQTLRARGHQVVIAAPPDFSVWAETLGFEFAPLGVNMQQFLADNPAILTGKVITAAPLQKRYFAEAIPRQVQELLSTCQGADAIVWAGLAFGSPSVAERLGIPALGVLYTTCVLPSVMHPPPFLSVQGLPSWVNRALWWLNDFFTARMVGRPLNLARRQIGLADVDFRTHLVEQSNFTVAVDEALFPGDPAWSGHVQRASYLYFNDTTPLDAELDAWLQAGEPPLYVGFGSMAGFGTQRIDALLQEALLPTGMRVLIGSGWAGLGGLQLPPHWRSVASAPHEKLFARVAAVVHHGGAGTTANALRAGVPQVILPLILDQYHHAHRLHLAGLIPKPVAMEKITAKQLAESVQAALVLPDGPRLALKQRLTNQQGCEQVAVHIEALLKRPSPGDA